MSRKHKIMKTAESCQSSKGDLQSSSGLEAIVHKYISQQQERATQELKFYRIQPNLEKAVEYAALCKMPDGKRHPHQRRIPRAALEEAEARLLCIHVEDCRNFHELIQTVDTTIRNIYRIGDLAIYDIALRLGAFLGLAPDRVYLHRGTREGARVLGLGKGQQWLLMAELPEPFHLLTEREAEDCLCIYKDELYRVAGV